MDGELARAEETPTPTQLPKECSGNGVADGCESLGQVGWRPGGSDSA
jgi:hypothetical protein